MKTVKKILKIVLLLFLILVIGLVAFDIYLIKAPELKAKKSIEGIESVAVSTNGLTINENAKIIGLGEATHGNAEFQEIKLDVLKVLVDKYDVNCFAMEMDYGEGVIINDYISGNSKMTIDEVMDHIVFPIYRTEEIKNLIEWMNGYNESHGDKLLFYGFDFQNPNIDLELILAFIEEHAICNDLKLNDSFDSYLKGDMSFRDEKLGEGFENLKKLQSELETNKELYQNIYNYERILDCTKNVFLAKELSDKFSGENGTVDGMLYRDQMMANWAIEISNRLDTTRMMITGHNGHIGYAGNYTKTMGSSIKDAIGDQYFTIGTDYFITNCNMADTSGKRDNHRFVSGDILAYQAKNLGTYYLNFSKVEKNSTLYQYVFEPIYTGSIVS